MSKYSWSYSSFSSAVTCLQKYKYCYIDKIVPDSPESGDLIFGSALHRAINSFLHGENGSEVFEVYWDSYKDKEIEYGRFKWQALKDIGLKLCSTFGKKYNKHYQMQGAEERLYGEYKGIKLEGSYDYIGLFNEKRSLIDFKTSAYNYPKDKELCSLQIYLYAYLVRSIKGYQPEQVGYMVFNKSLQTIQTQVWDFNEEDMYKALDTVVDYVKMIEMQDSFPKNYNACLYPRKCEYFSLCHKEKK